MSPEQKHSICRNAPQIFGLPIDDIYTHGAPAATAVDDLPDGMLDAFVLGAVNAWTRSEMDGGQSRLEGKLAAAEGEIRATWFAVEDVALKYGVAK